MNWIYRDPFSLNGDQVFNFMEAILNKELDQKILTYIATLEDINEELLKSLKYCVKLLTQIKPSVRNPQSWQEMLDVFQKTIRTGERIVGEKTQN